MLRAAGGSPAFAVLPNPIEERSFKTDIVAKPLRLQPLMAEDFFAFSEELLVER